MPPSLVALAAGYLGQFSAVCCEGSYSAQPMCVLVWSTSLLECFFSSSYSCTPFLNLFSQTKPKHSVGRVLVISAHQYHQHVEWAGRTRACVCFFCQSWEISLAFSAECKDKIPASVCFLSLVFISVCLGAGLWESVYSVTRICSCQTIRGKRTLSLCLLLPEASALIFLISCICSWWQQLLKLDKENEQLPDK